MNDTPNTSSAETENRIREELEKAASLISGARRLMGEGRTVELGALEDRMRAVTTAVQTAPEDIAQNYKDHLLALMEALDALEGDLNRQHQSLETGLNTIRRREAQGAYSTTAPPSPPADTTDDTSE